MKKWYKDIGAHVKEGDLLADIDTPEVDAQLAQAQADLGTAQANAKLSSITAARFQDLIKSDSVSHQEVDNFNGEPAAAKQAMVVLGRGQLRSASRSWNRSRTCTRRFRE